jgi:hypothetical protein
MSANVATTMIINFVNTPFCELRPIIFSPKILAKVSKKRIL